MQPFPKNKKLFSFARLSTRLIFSVSVIIVIGTLGLYYFISTTQQKLMFDSFYTSTNGTLQAAKLGIELSHSEEKFEMMLQVFNWIKTRDYFKYIYLTEESDGVEETLTAYPPTENKSKENLNQLFASRSISDSIYVLKTGWKSNIGAGNLYIGFSTEKIQAYKRQIIFDLTLFSLLILIFIIVVVALVATSITKPLNNLKNVSEKIRAGDLNERANEVKGGTEVTSVSQAFNQMVEELSLTQNKLLNINQTLENKVKERTAELLIAKEKAEEMSRLKSIFLNNMSHELRTPMIGIMGYAEILNDEIVEDDLKEIAGNIFHGGKRLTQTLNSILDLSKVESNELELQIKNFALADLTKKAVNEFQATAASKNLFLEVRINDEAISALVDKRLYADVVKNLVDNAIKFTQAGGVIIELNTTYLVDKKFASLKVTDTGIGIAEENHDLIFEPFRQVSEGNNRSYEGCGIGLTIVKKFVEVMNGKISLIKREGGGTIFIVDLPMNSWSN